MNEGLATVLGSTPFGGVWSARLALLALLAAICRADLRERRIPNRLVVAGLAVALLWQGFGEPGAGLFSDRDPGAPGLFQAGAGAALAFSVCLLLHGLRILGAGDVKLVTMVAAFVGLAALPVLMVLICLSSGVLVLWRLADDAERRRAVVNHLRMILWGALAGGGSGFDPRTDTADRLPFALAITGGVVALAALQLAGAIR